MPLTTLSANQKITAIDTVNRIKDTNIVKKETLLANQWIKGIYNNYICYYYKYSNPNITPNSIIEIGPSSTATFDQMMTLRNCFLTFKAQADGYIEMWNFGEVPRIDIPVEFIIRKDTTSL